MASPTIDSEKLIALIFKYNIIWDKRDRMHSNRIAVEQSWKELSLEMGFEDTQLKKKWKYLRDQFAVEWGKLPSSRSGDAADNSQTTKWNYFNQLLFLKDIVKPRASSGPLKALLPSETPSSSRNSVDVEEVISNASIEINDDSSSLTLDIDTQNETDHGQREEVKRPEAVRSQEEKRGKRKRPAVDDYQRSMLQLEERKLEYLVNKSKEKSAEKEDQDVMFLRSLLPHIKRIPQQMMLRFRRRLEELVEEFAYPMPNNLLFPRPTGAPVPNYHPQQSFNEQSPHVSYSFSPQAYESNTFQ